MSTPANPMDKYRSVSYQHVLAVANNTEVIRKYLDPHDSSITTSHISNATLGQAVKPSNIDASSSTDPGMFVVIDTRKNSNYSIKDIHYISNLGVGLPNQTQVISGKLEIQVTDPFGISFLNYIQHLVDHKLKTSLDGIVWLLQTFFVGHTDKGTTEIISTSGIPMIMISMQVTQLSSSGGQYALEFAPLTAGAPSFMPNASIIRDNVNFVTDKAGTLASALQGLENQLNSNLRAWYTSLQTETKSVAGEPAAKSHHGRLIQYMFTMPDSWKSFKVEGHADRSVEKDWNKMKSTAAAAAKEKTSEAIQADAKKLEELKASGKTTDAAALELSINDGKRYVTVLPHFTVDQALAELLKHCPEVSELASSKRRKNGNKDEPVTLFKTLSSITSDLETVVLHWDIIEFTLPIISKEDSKAIAQAKWFNAPTADNKEKKPVNSMEFDYIFSGKNADILAFDMKIANANLLMNSKAIISSKDLEASKRDKTQVPNANAAAPGEKIKVKKDFLLLREYDPVFKPEQTGAQGKGMVFVTEGSGLSTQLRQEQIRTNTDVYAASALNMKMRIRGNPNLLNAVTGKQAPHVKSLDALAAVDTVIGKFDDPHNTKRFTANLFNTGNELGTREYYVSFIKEWVRGIQDDITSSIKTKGTAIKHPASYPLFVKVNVFAPNIHDNSVNQGAAKFATKFWYDGWFMVQQIEQHFTDGKFEQDLVMLAYNVYDSITMNDKGATAADAKPTTKSSVK